MWIFGAEGKWTFHIGESRDFNSVGDWKSLFAPNQGYCHDDCFLVGAHVCVEATSVTVRNPHLFWYCLPLQKFVALMLLFFVALQASSPALLTQPMGFYEDAYNDPALSDVVLTNGETQIHAHKVVLSSHSPSFKAMFLVRY